MKVSVIVPTHNREATLVEALWSLAAQEYRDFEAVVINDGGETLVELVSPFPFASLVELETNQGVSAARNAGIRASRGEYIAYLDDDDVLLPNHLSTLVGFLDSSPCRVAYTDSLSWNATSGKTTVEFANPFSRRVLLKKNLAPIICYLHERSLLEEMDPWFQGTEGHEDWDFFIRLAGLTDFVRLPVVTCLYRKGSSGQMSASETMRDSYWQVRRKYAGYFS